MSKPVATVSCHVERPLDDDCWRRFSRLQERRPGGFAIAALLRPPDADAGEDAELWLERARAASAARPARAPHALRRPRARAACRGRGATRRAGPRRGAVDARARPRAAALLRRRLVHRRGRGCGTGRAGLRRLHGDGVRPVVSRRGRASSLRREPGVAHAPRRRGGCSSCRPRIRSAWRRGRRRARCRRTSTCTSTTRTCCRGSAGPRSRGRSPCCRPALRGHRPRQAPRGLERPLPSGPSP